MITRTRYIEFEEPIRVEILLFKGFPAHAWITKQFNNYAPCSEKLARRSLKNTDAFQTHGALTKSHGALKKSHGELKISHGAALH